MSPTKRRNRRVFEFSIALKYLVPRRRALSTALISALSVFVISLVVWLVLVFLSVTKGIEHNWLQKLTSLHAPLRITPTEAYYHSYYHQIDILSSASRYAYKTIGEKKDASNSDPYHPDSDAELPAFWPSPDRLSSGKLKDPVKTMFLELEKLQKNKPQIHFQDYEIGGALLRLNLAGSASTLSQMSYLLSLPEENPQLRSLFLPPEGKSIDFDQEPKTPPPYAYFVQGKIHLPDFGTETPVILPKSYQSSGLHLGDLGHILYFSPASTSAQEQKWPIRVAGFYDPGFLGLGNKCILVPKEITRTLYNSSQTFSPDGTPTNGVFVWTNDLSAAKQLKMNIETQLKEADIDSYWSVKTYEDFEFAKDLLIQFKSDRTLLLVVAAIILVVACSNIISLLVLLVNDKKKEIAILQSMGASFKSVAFIFGICGAAMGMLSCFLGTALALLTLKNLDSLVSFFSSIQGRAAFNPAFFGTSLPHDLSTEALFFVLIATPILSIAAGLIPAFKASRIRPASTLRGE